MRFEATAAVALILLLSAVAWSPWVYAVDQAILAFLGGLVAAIVLVQLSRGPKGLWTRLLALSAGGASTAFALFGPADGLF